MSGVPPQYNDNYGKHKYACSKPVVMFDFDWNYIDEFNSAAEAERLTGAKGISTVCKGKRRHAGGYRWKYKEDLELETNPALFY